MNIPNVLTVVRLFLIPIFVIVFFSQIADHLVFASLIFILAGITDILDGYIARKYHLITKLGQIMDPLADKLIQLVVLTCLTVEGMIPLWIIIIYGVKESTMIFGGLFLYTQKEKTVIPANIYGKIATFLFYLAVLSLAFNYQYSNYIFIIAVSFSILSFAQYFVIGSKKINILKNEYKN